MKKFFMTLAAVAVAATMNAQNEVGQITLKPMAGMTLATFTSDDDAKMKVGLAAGVEAEYGVTDKLGITAGLIYSMQGAKATILDKDYKFKMDYINIPILANYYVAKGFAIKAGLQPGFLVSAKVDGEDYKDKCKTFDLSIPLGLSYEYQSFVFDARYNIGLTKLDKDGESSSKNSVFMFTVGYKFAL